ncbi:hypothetical protein Tco_1292443 [Tanacetum coccineum]
MHNNNNQCVCSSDEIALQTKDMILWMLTRKLISTLPCPPKANSDEYIKNHPLRLALRHLLSSIPRIILEKSSDYLKEDGSKYSSSLCLGATERTYSSTDDVRNNLSSSTTTNNNHNSFRATPSFSVHWRSTRLTPPASVPNVDKADESTAIMPRKSFDTLADNLHDVMVETLPTIVDKHIKEQVMKTPTVRLRDQDDPHDDAHPEGENSAKRQKTSDYYDWETATYGKIWCDENVHNLRSVETEFPTIVFNDTLTSKVALSCEPTVSPFNDNQIDFRMSFDESDDEDYPVIYDKNSFSYKIIYVKDLKTDSENDNVKVDMPSFSSSLPMVSYYDDFDYFKNFEKEFSAIAYNDALTSKLDFSEHTVSPQHIDEFDETSLFECDGEEQNVIYFNDQFPFNVIYPGDFSR